jgi:hypothetical protein
MLQAGCRLHQGHGLPDRYLALKSARAGARIIASDVIFVLKRDHAILPKQS